MKKIAFWIGILLFAAFIASCSTQNKVTKKKAKPVKIEKSDSTEYELLIFDQGFETWYAMQNTPAKYHSLNYYENWNRQYVNAWDAKSMNPARYPFFQTIIGYDPSVQYGFKLNHKLFYYFQYVENVLKIPIIPGGGPHVLLY